MSETALTPPDDMTPTAAPEDIFLDGDAPRLGASTFGVPSLPDAAAAPSLPDAATVTAPVIEGPGRLMPSDTDVQATTIVGASPDTPAPSLPTLPMVIPATPAAATSHTGDTGDTGDTTDEESTAPEDQHPMAHLMGATSAKNNASRHAAEVRAKKKAKAKKMKVVTAIGALVVTVVAGPPLWSWFSDALNEAGGTEQPAD